jgi:hypothetical protein
MGGRFSRYFVDKLLRMNRALKQMRDFDQDGFNNRLHKRELVFVKSTLEFIQKRVVIVGKWESKSEDAKKPPIPISEPLK